MRPLSRRALGAAAIIVLPIAFVAGIEARDNFWRFLAFAWGALGIAIAWMCARSLSRRIAELKAFAGTLPGARAARPSLKIDDSELGDLARSLSRAAPKIEEALHGLSTELARREAILGNMAEAVVAVDARLHVSFCNRSFGQTVATHPVAEGVPLIKVLRDPGLFQLLQRVIASGDTVRQRLQISGREERTYDVYATPLGGGPAPGALSILYDVTPMERLERTKRDFVANVSHEFRTPLATINGYAETLLNGGLEDPENRRKFVEIIQANSMRLNQIAADLIALSELETGQSVPPEPMNVEEAIRSAVSTIEPVARMQEIRLREQNTPGLEILGHRFRFEQAVLNLLDNAIKFNGPGGEVSLAATLSDDGNVEITVSDSGIGIPPEDLPRIFERFYRVDKARSRPVGGTGLGLSIVRHSLEQMQGTITVESELGRGSRFTIRLPRHQPPPSSS